MLTGCLATTGLGVAVAERMEAEIWSAWKGDHSFLGDSMTMGEALGVVIGGRCWLVETGDVETGES